MLTPFIPTKLTDKIEETILKIVPPIPQQYKLTQLQYNNDQECTHKTFPVIKGITKNLHDLNKTEDMLLNDIFGGIKY